MSRASELLQAALLRPVNLLAPGAGLLLALTAAPWWVFPLSIALYATMVVLTVRDPAFVRRVASVARRRERGRADRLVGARERARSGRVGGPPRSHRDGRAQSRARACAVARCGAQRPLFDAGAGAHRGGARHAARAPSAVTRPGPRWECGNEPRSVAARSGRQARRAAGARDEMAARALSDAAMALDESARTAESLRTLRERTAAQLESLSAMLESVAVRGVRLRVQSDDGSGDSGRDARRRDGRGARDARRARIDGRALWRGAGG